MKLRRLTLVFGLALGLLAFVALSGSAGAADTVTIQLKAQNGSGQDGTATITDLGNGSIKVVVDLSNSPAGPQPLHIHEGTCANLNPTPKYPLTNLMNGKSETTVNNLTLSALLASPYAINAHKSTTEAAVYVSCGEIVAQAPTAAPRTGGGGMAANNHSPLAWAAIAALLTITVVGATYALRRREA